MKTHIKVLVFETPEVTVQIVNELQRFTEKNPKWQFEPIITKSRRGAEAQLLTADAAVLCGRADGEHLSRVVSGCIPTCITMPQKPFQTDALVERIQTFAHPANPAKSGSN